VTATWLAADYGGQLCMPKAGLMWDNIGDSDASKGINVFVIRVIYIAAAWL
jgi:hypothetical protein